jgi:hypothetical protein
MGQPFLVGDTERGKAFRDGAETETLRRDMFLPLHVSRTRDPSESLEPGVGQFEVFENRLECAAIASVIPHDFGNLVASNGVACSF